MSNFSKIRIGTSIVLSSVLFSATSALADDTSTTSTTLTIKGPFTKPGLPGGGGPLQQMQQQVQPLKQLSPLVKLRLPAGFSAAGLAGTIGSVNSVFLEQQGSAFVTAPGNKEPDQAGGGVWVRALGGENTIKSTSTSELRGSTGSQQRTTWQNVQHQSFAGMQVGADLARLNWNGWNVHVGGMAGYLGSKMSNNSGFADNTVEVPFFGSYLVVSKGRFFADLMVRRDYFNLNLANAELGIYNQPIGAQAVAMSTAAGYHFDAGNGWFIEPSAGFVYSNTSVDSFINPQDATRSKFSTDNIESELGRLSLRVGTTVETPNVIWQPFAAATVFHEFAGDVVTRVPIPNSMRTGPGDPNQITTTSRVGTYGQYSLGMAAQFVNTGLVSFVRADYRNGDNIEGWSANAGFRYSFVPETVASVMPVKAVPSYSPSTNWTGVYVGGFAGAAVGRSNISIVGDRVNGSSPWLAGGIGGVELGYNYQFADKWVVGIEADIGAGNVHGGRPVEPTLNYYTATGQSDWTGIIAGRLGYMWNRTLVYAKGGVAFADSSTSFDCIYGPTGAATSPARACTSPAGQAKLASFSTPHSVRVGYAVGVGAEFDLSHNWSVKSEYDVLSFGRHNSPTDDGATVIADKTWVNQVKVGLNYRFAPGANYP